MKIEPYNNRIKQISPYIPGAYSKVAGQRLIKLSSNENPLGASSKVTKLLQNATKNLNRYPDGGCVKLRNAIAELHNINPDQIVCGAGSDEIITLLCMAYTGNGAEIIHTNHGFLMYPLSALACGATPIVADEVGLKANIENIISKITSKTKIIFLANPNNPTGSYLKDSELDELISKIPKNIIIVLDLAYAEYAKDIEDYPNAIDLVNKHHNVVMMRTFSKAYGIPALRLGWAYASSEIIDILNRVRGPFNVSSLAQEAGIAAIEDQEFINKSVELNNNELKRLESRLQNLGVKTYPSIANFILVDFETPENATKIYSKLNENGISTRKMDAYKLPSCIRISIGLEEENDILLNYLAEILK